jgi:hypothetical protein
MDRSERIAGADGRVDEERLISALQAGQWADLTREPGYDPARKPLLDAAVLRRIALGLDPRLSYLPAGLRLAGLRLEGDLDLADCLGHDGGGLGVLALEHCDLPGRINVSNTQLTRLSIRYSRFRELWGEGVGIRGDFDFRQTSALPDGEGRTPTAYIRMRGARIGGDVWGRGARLQAPSEPPAGLSLPPDALNLWLATIGGSLFLEGNPTLRDRFECSGGLNITGAQIAGDLAFRGALLLNSGDIALSAGDVSVGGDALMGCLEDTGFEAQGEVRFSNGRIGRDIDLSGARLSNAEGDAFDASGCSIGGNLRFMSLEGHRFTSTGQILLINTKIGGYLGCMGASFSNPSAIALNAEGLEVAGQAIFNVMSDQRFEARGEIRISNARIGRDCEFQGASLHNPEGDALDASGSTIGGHLRWSADGEHRFESDGRIALFNVSIGGDLACFGGRLSNPGGVALGAGAVTIGGNVIFNPDASSERCRLTGAVFLNAGAIKGRLDLDGSLISCPGAIALSAEGLQIGADAMFNVMDGARFEAEGEVRLAGASIGRNCDFRGARLSHPEGDSLDANGAVIGGHMRLMAEGGIRFESQGRIVLYNARLSGDLTFLGAHLANPQSVTLAAFDIQIGGDAVFSNKDDFIFESDGGLVLVHAKIGGMLLCQKTRIALPGGLALNAEGASIGASLRAHDNQFTGDVGLAVTRIDALGSFAASAWRGAGRLVLDDISLRQILVDPDDGVPWKERSRWLRSNSFRDKHKRLIVSPHPWRECASAFARSGRHLDARRLQREGYREENRARPAWQKFFVWLFAELPFGFGLSTLRTTATVLCFWLIGAVGAQVMHARGVLVPSGESAGAGCPSLAPALYALDTAIPFLDLRQEALCDPAPAGQTGLVSDIVLPWPAWLGLPPQETTASPAILLAVDEITLWQWAKTIYAVLGSLVIGFAAVAYSGVFKPKE